MITAFDTLAHHARQLDAKFTVSFEPGRLAQVKWRSGLTRDRDRVRETVTDHEGDLTLVLIALLNRLHLRREDVPSDASFIARMNAAQLQRVRAALADIKAVRYEVEHPIAVEDLEPCLASPRSSLGRHNFQGEPDEA